MQPLVDQSSCHFETIHDYVYHVLFWRYRPLKLPLSCEVGENVVLNPRFFYGKGIPQILDMHFQIALTS